MLQIVKTAQFEKWLKRIKDAHARSIIEARIGKIAFRGELCGDWKNLGEDLFDPSPMWFILKKILVGPQERIKNPNLVSLSKLQPPQNPLSLSIIHDLSPSL